jgi:hypothetical protein
VASASACGDPETNQPSSANTASPSIGIQSALRATLQKNFDLATKGGPKADSRMAQMPSGNSAGLDCTPARLDRNAHTFQLVLPPRSVDREGTLAAIAPDGSLHIIYISYNGDTDPEDLVIPSKSLDWKLAKERGSFMIDARSFDALLPHKDVSKPLFREEGVYQLALMNSAARDLLASDNSPFWVIAGCVVRWSP